MATPVAAFEPVPVQDEFDRADGMTLGVSPSGHIWTQHAGGFSVSGGQAAGTGGYGLASVDSVLAEAAVGVTVAAAGQEHWLVIRLQGPNDYWRFGRAGGGAYQLQLVRSGALAQPAVTTLRTLPAADGDRLECRSAATLTCSVNGQPVVRTEDPSFAAATRHGLATWQGSDVRFDDFFAGPIPVVADLSVSLDAPAQVPAGGQLTATAVLNNNGLGHSTTTTVEWTLPTDLADVSGTTPTDGCTMSGDRLTCSVGDLAPGAGVSLTLTARAPTRSGTLVLAITATHAAADASPADDTATAAVLLRADLDPGTVVADGFDRADDARGLGTAETGQQWSTAAGAPALSGGTAAPGSGYGLTTLDSGASNGTVSATVTSLGTEFWLVVRFSDSGEYWRFGRAASGPYRLQLVHGGRLASPVMDVRSRPLPAEGDLVSCRLTDTAISCSVGETVVSRTTDARARTATRHGLAAYASPEARFDRFSVVGPSGTPDLRAALTTAKLLASGSESAVTATIDNAGSAPAPAAGVVIELPVGASAAQELPSACSATGTTVTCLLGDIPAGGSATVTVTMHAPALTGPATTTATVSSTVPDEDTADNATSSTTLIYGADQPAPLAWDSFSRADASTLETSETGQPWVEHVGSVSLIGAAAAPIATGYALATLDAGSGNGTVTMRVAEPGPEFWTVLRLEDAANYWRFGRSGGGPYRLEIVKQNALGDTGSQVMAAVSPAAGDRIVCRLGSGISCSVNGATVVRTLNPSFAAATRHGLASWQSPQARLDDFAVAPLPPVADLAVGLSGTRSVEVGGAVAFTATVGNVGTAAADGTRLRGLLPTGTTNLSVTSDSGACTSSGVSFECVFGALPPGLSRSADIRASAPTTAGAVTTTVTGTTTSPDGEPGNDEARTATTVRLPAPPGAVVRDDFDRADAPALGATPTGQSWTTHSGDFSIVSGQAATTSAGTNVVSVDPGFTFGTFDATVSSGAKGRWWLALRVQDALNHYRVGPDPVSGHYRLSKVVNGVEGPVFANYVRRAVPAADGDNLRVIVRPDDSIYVWVNGQQVIDAGDVDLMDVAAFGFGTMSADVRFDDLVVSAVLDAFPVTDSFSRPDTAADLGAPEVGTLYPWRVWLGDDWAVRSGAAAPTTEDEGLVAIDASMEAAGVQARFSALGDAQWLIFRYSELDGSYYRFGAVTGGRYELQFVRGYAVQELPVPVQTSGAPLVAAGQSVSVLQQLDGSVQLAVDGTVTHRFTDISTNARTTIYGLAAKGSSARFDDVLITPAPRP